MPAYNPSFHAKRNGQVARTVPERKVIGIVLRGKIIANGVGFAILIHESGEAVAHPFSHQWCGLEISALPT